VQEAPLLEAPLLGALMLRALVLRALMLGLRCSGRLVPVHNWEHWSAQ
jgi:hypothetical protein